MNEILETTAASTGRTTLAEPTPAMLSRLGPLAVDVLEIPDDLADLIEQPPERLHHFFERRCDAHPAAVALIAGAEQFTYAELDRRANRLSHLLIRQGVGQGTTVGILLERSVHTYVALLAVLKTGAAFVPIDPSYPPDRVGFIAADAGLTALLTTSALAAGHPNLPCPAISLDNTSLGRLPDSRPEPPRGDGLAYIIYTSGTTGRPKGVAVNHSHICHFLSVCTPIYGVGPEDRVYQGMTIAFDFSIEEIWPTWIAGATLVAGPTGNNRLGPGLAEFLDRTPDHGALLRSHAPVYARPRPAGRAHPHRGRRGLPARPGGPLVPAGPAHAQHLRTHRDHRHGHLVRTGARTSGDHWPAHARLPRLCGR